MSLRSRPVGAEPRQFTDEAAWQTRLQDLGITTAC